MGIFDWLFGKKEEKPEEVKKEKVDNTLKESKKMKNEKRLITGIEETKNKLLPEFFKKMKKVELVYKFVQFTSENELKGFRL